MLKMRYCVHQDKEGRCSHYVGQVAEKTQGKKLYCDSAYKIRFKKKKDSIYEVFNPYCDLFVPAEGLESFLYFIGNELSLPKEYFSFKEDKNNYYLKWKGEGIDANSLDLAED